MSVSRVFFLPELLCRHLFAFVCIPYHDCAGEDEGEANENTDDNGNNFSHSKATAVIIIVADAAGFRRRLGFRGRLHTFSILPLNVCLGRVFISLDLGGCSEQE